MKKEKMDFDTIDKIDVDQKIDIHLDLNEHDFFLHYKTFEIEKQ